MIQTEHESRLRTIEPETEDPRRQIMQFEFQHKKEIAEADPRIAEYEGRFDAKHIRIQRQIDHLVKLTGLTYDELDEMDATLTESGIVLTRPRKRARVK